MKNGPWLPKLPIPDMLVAGILLMLAGDFMFALNDAMGKWLVASFSVGQVVLVRSIGAFLILGPMIARQGAGKLFRMERVGAAGPARRRRPHWTRPCSTLRSSIFHSPTS